MNQLLSYNFKNNIINIITFSFFVTIFEHSLNILNYIVHKFYTLVTFLFNYNSKTTKAKETHIITFCLFLNTT